MARDIVFDADRETVLGRLLREVVKDGQNAGGVDVLGAKPVPTAHHNVDVAAGLCQRRHHVEVERLAQRPGLLAAVEHGDAPDALWQRIHKAVDGKGTIQANLEQAHFFALVHQMVDDLLGRIAHRAHGDDDALGLRVAIVVEQAVVCACQLVDAAHGVLHHGGQRLVVGVGGFLGLEEDVGVLRRAAQGGVFGIQRAGAIVGNGLAVEHAVELLVAPHRHLLDLMGGAKPVEKVQEGDAALDGRQMGHGAQIHDLLRVGGCQQRKSRLTAGHHVLMVAEDREGVAGQGARRTVDDGGQQLAGHLIEVGHHQQKALRCGEGGGEGAGRQRAVHRACGAAFRLHLGDFDLLAKEVLATRGRPVVHQFGHNRRGGDGEDGCHFRKGVSHMGGCRVSIHGFHGAWSVVGGHVSFLLWYKDTKNLVKTAKKLGDFCEKALN